MEKDETKYLYYKLEFTDCFMEYDETICETLKQVHGYLHLIDTDLDDITKHASVRISGIGMTRAAYKSFLKSIKQPNP